MPARTLARATLSLLIYERPGSIPGFFFGRKQDDTKFRTGSAKYSARRSYRSSMKSNRAGFEPLMLSHARGGSKPARIVRKGETAPWARRVFRPTYQSPLRRAQCLPVSSLSNALGRPVTGSRASRLSIRNNYIGQWAPASVRATKQNATPLRASHLSAFTFHFSLFTSPSSPTSSTQRNP